MGNSTISLVGCTITSATATRHDGGCIVADKTSTVHLVGSLVSGCRSDTVGGGMSVVGTAKATIVDSNFHSNAVTGAVKGNGGAVAAIDNATVSIRGSQFVGNNARWCGGAISAEGNAQIDILPSAKSGMQAGKHADGGC
jgi:hypothetical protein